MPDTPVKLRLGWQRASYLAEHISRHQYAYAIMTIVDGVYQLEKVVAGPDGAIAAGVSVGARMSPHGNTDLYAKRNLWEFPITKDLPSDSATWDRLIQHAVQRHAVQTERLARAHSDNPA